MQPQAEGLQVPGGPRQARELARRTRLRLDRTERVANSLGKLAGVVARLNQELEHDVKVRCSRHSAGCCQHCQFHIQRQRLRAVGVHGTLR